MISSHVFNTGERSPKGITPYSPQAKRKNLDFTVHTPMPTPTTEYQRKEVSNGALSPHGHLYTQKLQPTTIDGSTERDFNLQILVRDLSDRVKKISQKLGQHESILIKMTQNSIQNNKQQCRKGGQGKIDFAKITDAVNQNVNKLRREFEEFRSGHILTRQVQVKNQLFSELIHKTEERMRDQIQAVIRKVNEFSTKTVSSCSDERLEDHQKLIKKLEKGIALNSGKINSAYQKIESISSSIDGHMELVNAEVNKAIAKIVGFVNEKVSKPLTENLELLSRRIDVLQTEIKSASHTIWHFGGLRASSLKSTQEITKAEYRQTLTAYDSQIIISQNTYYIDRQGYLLDSQHYYLLDSRNERIRLDERQIAALTSQKMIG